MRHHPKTILRQGRSLPALDAWRRALFFIKLTASIVLLAFINLTLHSLALAAHTTSEETPAARTPGNAEKLAQTLNDIEDRLEKLEQKLGRQQSVDQEKVSLNALRKELDILDQKGREDFAKIEKHLKDKQLPKTILTRHYEAVKTYQAEMTALKANLDDLDQAQNDAERKIRTQKAKGHLKSRQAKHKRSAVDPNNLPTRALKPNRNNKPKLHKDEFTRAGLYDTPTARLAALGDFTFDKLPGASDPAYLAPTPEVILSDAIKAKAEELEHNPVKIYSWVRNNVEWVPSWGSIQGADLTLRNLKGNAIDTASLLVSLLRASGIPARYVHGTIEVPAVKFLNWAGGFSDANSAWDFASAGGVPITAMVSGGKISVFQMEHVWVEAAVDYYPSRGAINKSADLWLPLDPSFKQYDITAGTDLTALVPFSADNYLSQLHSENPIQYYQHKIQNYLDANMVDKTIGQVAGFRFIRAEESKSLPSGMPYKTVVAANRYGSLPSGLRITATLKFSSSDGLSDQVATLPTIELAGKRLTLSYIPASPADEALITSHGGDRYAVPTYLLYLKPVLKADGQTLYTGPEIQMGQEQKLHIIYQGLTVYASSAPHTLVAGGYYALGLNLQGVNESVVGHSNHGVIETLTTKTPLTAQIDDTLGQHLYALAMTYYLMNDKLYRGAAKLYQVEQQRTLSAGMIGISPTISYVFGIPRSATPNRLRADIGLEAIQANSREGRADKLRTFMELRGLVGSYSENAVFEAIHGFDAVSAVKAIQASAAKGVTVYKIDQTNAAQLLPQLQLAPEDKQEIQDGIAVGLIVIAPQREITINQWTGTGFIIKDPQTSSGVYRISGGLSGGSTTQQVDGFQIVSLFKGAFAWLKDKLDVMTRAFIATFAQANIGEKIGETAEELARTKAGYENVNECSGLVRMAYLAAGICLDKFNGSGGCKDDLVTRFGIDTKDLNGVAIHYNLVNALKINNSVRVTNDPLVGDIVFFSNTSGPGHPLNHEGIVVRGPDAKGTIQTVDATRSSGADFRKMNAVMKDSCAENAPPLKVRDPSTDPPAPQCCIACTAGSLFVGFGTVRDPKVLGK